MRHLSFIIVVAVLVVGIIGLALILGGAICLGAVMVASCLAGIAWILKEGLK